MDKIIFTTAFLLVSFCVPFTTAQGKQGRLDGYLEEATNIVVVRCISVGPVNILLQARTEVEILHVVKGQETLRTLTVISHVELKPGKLYLIRTTNKTDPKQNYFKIDNYDSAIPIPDIEDLNILKTLSPRIVVLRTMNLRADRLRSQIDSAQYELDLLNNIRDGN